MSGAILEQPRFFSTTNWYESYEQAIKQCLESKMVFPVYCSNNSNVSQAYYAFKALVKVLHNSNKEQDQQVAKVAILKKEKKE